MQEILSFSNPEFGVIRSVEINGAPWFVGKDVAVCLGYTNPQKAIRTHVDHDDITTNDVFVVNGTKAALINESGLYALILSSKLPTAKEFKHWVTSDVLPSIRKHGAYITPEQIEKALINPDIMIQLCMTLKAEQERNRKLEEENPVMRPKSEYFDNLVERRLLTNFRDTAKELKVKEKEFIQFLLDKKYIYRSQKGILCPYAQFVPEIFEMKECASKTSRWVGTQTLITPKGRETFRLLCKREDGIN